MKAYGGFAPLFLIPARGYIVRWGCCVGFRADLNPMGEKNKILFSLPHMKPLTIGCINYRKKTNYSEYVIVMTQ
jgi:hypothetical protein